MDTSPQQQNDAPSGSIRVLHAHTGNIYGGVEVGLQSMSRLGPSRGIDAEFALCFEGRSADELRAAERPLYILGAARIRYPWQVMAARRKLRAVLQAGRYDAVVVHNTWGLATLARTIRAAGVPLVFHLHGAFEKKSDIGRIDRLARRWAPDLVVCNSAYSASTLDHLFPGVRREVVYTPLQVRPPAPGARASLRRELGAGDDEVVLLQASRLDTWKGHRLHLEALSRIKTERRWQSWIAGGPQQPGERHVLEGLVAYARSLGLGDRVRFLGQRQDVPELMAAADVLCQPNTAPEPFGLAFIEALAAGLPVVTSAMGGALEIVNATCGFLLPPAADAVAGALTTLIEDDDLRARMNAPAKARAREICDPDRQTRMMRDVIESVARPKRSH